MERELWPVLYQAARQVGQRMHQKYVTFQPWIIACVVLWAALHDRPRCWACEKKNWSTTTHRPLQLPSASVLSRRAESVIMGHFWRMLEEALRENLPPGLLSIVDGKPLLVGGYSKDPDARRGYGVGFFGRGYKLHTIWGTSCLPDAWDVTPLNESEPVVAESLVKQLQGGGYLLGDANYDTNPFHDAAGQRGYQVLAQDRRKNAGQGHHRQSPFRQRGIELRQGTFGQSLLSYRGEIERRYAHATIFAGGLAPLPAWVRREGRVRTWVWCKLLINATRLLAKQQLAA
jgi:hypothetical protein